VTNLLSRRLGSSLLSADSIHKFSDPIIGMFCGVGTIENTVFKGRSFLDGISVLLHWSRCVL
jgi:hypothetical protein